MAMTCRSLLLGLIASCVAASGCHAQAPTAQPSHSGGFAPSDVRQLQSFGAVGDGTTDDTAALRRALANSDSYCLDGGGRTYRVSGTLHATKSLCLRNATLVQSLAPFDTAAYVRHSCPLTQNASAVLDCGDPAVPAEDLPRLRQWLSVRTLLIRADRPGAGIQVTLDHVKVDRGRYPQAGSRTDSAGIYIFGADGADLRNVEITGDGKGFGLAVLRSRNVTVDNLWVHDLVWAPYAGEAPLSEDRVAAIGWNSVPIHEFRSAGEDGAEASKFYGVRVQEQVTCALFSQVQHVVIRDPHISHCMAQFSGGDLPWQADGLDISNSSSDVTVESPTIESTWEGMDIVGDGTGIQGLVISNPRISDSFGFGLKVGYNSSNVHISNAVISDAGIAAIMLYGRVAGITISGAQISGVGVVAANGRTLVPWPRQVHSGIHVDHGSAASGAGVAPRNIDLENVTVTNAAHGPSYEFGILNTGGGEVHVHGLGATGFSKGRAMGVSPGQ